MKIKSLLLGSAAVMTVVTGARAADPVIVEAEPVEYVRICDAYGAGFYYIPGTETCLKFSGYVRVDYSVRHIHDGYTQTKGAANVRVTDEQRHRWNYRGRFNIDARNETEWGTLRSQLRFQGDGGDGNSAVDNFSANEGPGDANAVIDRALIELAGFRVGYSDDYWTTIGGYGYYSARFDGLYNYTQGIFFDYTYAADGFTFTAGVEDNFRSGTAGKPDLYVGADYSGAWGRIFGTYYYDSSQSAGAYKGGIELSLADYLPGGAIKGWYMADDGDTDYVKGHAWGVTAKMNLTDNVGLFAGYSDYDCTSLDCTGVVADRSATHWTAGARWNVATGLYIQVEYSKTNYDFQRDGVVGATSSRLSTGTANVRVVRSF